MAVDARVEDSAPSAAEAAATDVTRLLGAQFDARVKALGEQLAEQLERAEMAAMDAVGLADEVRRREQAEEALERSEQAIIQLAGRI